MTIHTSRMVDEPAQPKVPQHPKEYEAQWARYAAAYVATAILEDGDYPTFEAVYPVIVQQAATFADAMLEQQRMRFARVD